MYVCIARAKPARPIGAAARAKIASAVDALFVDGHHYDSMQYHFIRAIMVRVQKLNLSKTRQAREVLQVHKNKYYELLDWTQEKEEK
ncbi:MAG TPA: hypothetical protein VHA33_29345 [Candidatus Angelobacter sp.]|jgi:hypothetical protein|nr:hypothetical protein [Candidatus Angelobacter sp.]